jgi:S-adenosylmethionine-diacylgycerolhomoserine-N-methlytransferase
MADAAVRMDRQYRWQRHIYDVTRMPYLLGRDRLITELDPPFRAHILEIGC